MKLLFSSDLHGNDGQYLRLFSYAAQHKIPAVIIGGDIAPKHFPDDIYIQAQRAWYTTLDAALRLYRKANPRGNVFMMMGNDDARTNLRAFRKVLSDNGALYLHGQRHAMGNVDIVGYSMVPITPFGIKDWERNDVLVPTARSEELGKQRLSNLTYDGEITRNGKWVQFRVPERPSIQDDLRKPVYTKNSRTVLVTHSPPIGTALDQINAGHVGSIAIREFIEQRQPLITLHGHVHETVDVTGEYFERIGNTASYSCGNHNTTRRVAAILVDTDKPFEGKRLIL